MKLKSANAQFKTAGDADAAPGRFEAIVSVFGNVDRCGEVVRQGAFVDTIADWQKSGNALPVLWSHRMDDPLYNIGAVLDIAELAPGDSRIPDWVNGHAKNSGGLWVSGQLDTGADAPPIAAQAWRLLKARRVTQFSFAYDEIDSGPATVDGREIWELRKLKLYEVSPTQVGANELTELLAAKAAGLNASTVREALAALAAIPKDGDACDSGPAKSDEEPIGAKSDEEPARLTTASIRLLSDLGQFEVSIR